MTTYERLIKIFNAVFEEEMELGELTPDANLRDDVGIGSIGMLYAAMALEEEFGVKFTNQDFETIVTVNDVVACIDAKL